MLTDKEVDDFVNAYLITAVWSSVDEQGFPLDNLYSVEDFSEDAKNQARQECIAFIQSAEEFLKEENCLKFGPNFTWIGRAGHDFWLTRNHDGAGFWDGDWEKTAGEMLTKLADVGERYIEVANGKLIFF